MIAGVLSLLSERPSSGWRPRFHDRAARWPYLSSTAYQRRLSEADKNTSARHFLVTAHHVRCPV